MCVRVCVCVCVCVCVYICNICTVYVAVHTGQRGEVIETWRYTVFSRAPWRLPHIRVCGTGAYTMQELKVPLSTLSGVNVHSEYIYPRLSHPRLALVWV